MEKINWFYSPPSIPTFPIQFSNNFTCLLSLLIHFHILLLILHLVALNTDKTPKAFDQTC